MAIYISNLVINLEEKFILSFSVDLSSGNELLAIGTDRTEKPVRDISQFISQLSHGVVIDNGVTLIRQSPQYATDGNYIWRKDGQNNELLGIKLGIVNGKVYEEVKDISSYNAEEDMMNIFVKNDKLFKYIPDKYVISNGQVKLDKSQVKLTSIFSFEGGSVKLEQYLIQDNLQGFTDKLRFIFNNHTTTLDVAKRVDGTYQNVQTFFYSTELSEGRIYLAASNVTCSNLTVNYGQLS